MEKPERSAVKGGAELFDGKVFGVYKPLEVSQSADRIEISGETFVYAIDRRTGQITSAKALGTEFVAQGTSFPNPYVGLMPDNDPGASQYGGTDRPRYGFEKAIEFWPKLFSGGLTGAKRNDAENSVAVSTDLVSSVQDDVVVKASGRYAAGPDTSSLTWEITYRIDVDGFTKVTVRLGTDRPLKLRWHSFLHGFFDREAVDFLSRNADPDSPPFGIDPAPTMEVKGLAVGEPVLESHWTSIVHLGNPLTGIEFTKEDFGDRHGGYRDSRVRLEDGRNIATGSVETEDGRVLNSYDSRGKRDVFSQIYVRDRGLELEEFDIRNTTYPLNPGEYREKTFFMQLTPPKLPRTDLNSTRIVWPGPHQIQMPRWRGRTQEWEPPSDDLVRQWAAVGINLIVGGANYFSGDYSHPTHPEKVRHFIETVHSYGMKIIPYVTFSDYDFEAPGYQEHAAEWMSSKDIEYAQETTLMCFGADGWRDHVVAEIDSLLANFDFDGLYVDHWFNTRHCNNERHGCGGYLGRFVTEGYHDFARRFRQVVAKYTDGRGILLLNSNALISSTNLAWFDLRLLGENNDPLVAPGSTIMSIWNGKRTGVQSVIMWRENQDALDMQNFCATFGFSVRLRGSNRINQGALADWTAAVDPAGELGFNRLYWDVLRFFDVNSAEMFSAFDSRDVLSCSQPGSMVTAFARDGKLLLLAGYLAGGEQAPGARPVRREKLQFHKPEQLGLNSGTRYRVTDLASGAYLINHSLTPDELNGLDLELTLGKARMLLVSPELEPPALVFFRGADGVKTTAEADKLTFEVNAVPGAPVVFYLEAGGAGLRPATDGFVSTAGGGLTVISGTLPEDRKVVILKN